MVEMGGAARLVAGDDAFIPWRGDVERHPDCLKALAGARSPAGHDVAAKKISDELRSQQLRLLSALDVLAEAIADVANSLSTVGALDFIDRELSNIAVQMRKAERGSRPRAASLGYTIDVCLRQKISERLAELGA